jgi:hypothetical protein
MSNGPSNSRRRFLHLTGVAALAGVAGCSGGGGDGGGETTEDETTMEGDETTMASGGDEVPEAYVTATAQAGGERDPEALSSKSAVNYQSEPKDGQQCSGCQFYIPDKNGDGQGACSIVEGVISPDGWCASYVAYEG